MIFLIDYDRDARELVSFKRYYDSQREQAQNDRLALELELLPRGLKRHIVILEAESESVLRGYYTHYFTATEDTPFSALVEDRVNQ